MRHLHPLLVGCGLLLGCAAGEPSAPKAEADGAAAEAATPTLAEFDTLWNYGDPAATRAKFEALLDQASAASPYDAYLQLKTQIARTHGLEGDFETARTVLEGVENRRLVAPDDVPQVVHVRYLLELGRTWNSEGAASKAVPFFLDAWKLAKDEKLHYHAVDAAHMLGIVTAGADSLSWNRRAMEYAEQAGDKRAQRWLGPLYNNIGWTYHDMGRFEQALEMWEKGLAFRTKQEHSQESIWIADWTVARAHRSLGRHDEALTRLRRIESERGKAGKPSGYVYEEIGENLHAQGKGDEARPWFAKAWTELSKDAWLVEHQPERIARIRELSHQSD
ncbi:MAG: tetratricopeptide repeat protein [Planctomycetota bacterium]|jgi:tetratricopeptide (TPR) repeat protein